MLKSLLARIGNGLLLGIGISIAFSVFTYGYTQWQIREMEENAEEMFGLKNYNGSDLVIREHRPQRAENNSAFIGVVANTGTDGWDNAEFLVELYDEKDAFIDKCTGYLDGSIAPGQERNFKVTCQNCRDPALPLTYARYTIEIVGANYVQPPKRRAS